MRADGQVRIYETDSCKYKRVFDYHESAEKKLIIPQIFPSPKLTVEMIPLEGLVIAIKKELEAMQMYTQFAKAAVDVETQLLFTLLANMERSHKARMEDIYTNMAFPEVW